MGYAQRLIGRILDEERARGGSLIDGKTYRDEPILRTGADLLRQKQEQEHQDAPHRTAARESSRAWRNSYGHTRRSIMGHRSFDEVRDERRRRDAQAQASFDAFGNLIDNARASEPSCELPPLLKQLRDLETEANALILPENQLFVQQALLAAGYEDDFAYDGTFHHYFPTYRSMSDRQLRGYFSWRTKVRRGDVRRTSLSFAFVHLYELINSIGPDGVMTPEEGMRALVGFSRAYGERDSGIKRYARAWCRDYAVYHGLDEWIPRLFGNGDAGNVFEPTPEKAADVEEPEGDPNGAPVQARPYAHDEALATLEALEAEGQADTAADVRSDVATSTPTAARELDPSRNAPPLSPNEAGAATEVGLIPNRGAITTAVETETAPVGEAGTSKAPVSDEALFGALALLSSYRLDQSRLLKEDGDALRTVVCGTWRALSTYYHAHRKRTLVEHLFGVRSAQPYAMFRSAVFRAADKHPDTVVQIGPITRFICENGRWRCERYHNAGARNRELGTLAKAVDARLRDRLELDIPLKPPSVPKYVERIIDKQIDALLAKRKAEETARAEAKRREITIDLSKLAGIRAEAEASCEALLVDEERALPSDGLANAPIETPANETADLESAGKEGFAPSASAAEKVATATDARTGSTEELRAAETFAASPVAGGGPAAEAAPTAGTESPANVGSPFAPAELAYLRALLARDTAARRAALQEAGIPESMMMDAINEKMLDILGDIALEEGDSGPELFEDYVEDVRGIVEA